MDDNKYVKTIIIIIITIIIIIRRRRRRRRRRRIQKYIPHLKIRQYILTICNHTLVFIT